jgi:hypothetical protein
MDLLELLLQFADGITMCILLLVQAFNRAIDSFPAHTN